MTAKRLTVRYNSTASRRKGRIDGYVSTLELMREPLVQNQFFLNTHEDSEEVLEKSMSKKPAQKEDFGQNKDGCKSHLRIRIGVLTNRRSFTYAPMVGSMDFLAGPYVPSFVGLTHRVKGRQDIYAQHCRGRHRRLRSEWTPPRLIPLKKRRAPARRRFLCNLVRGPELNSPRSDNILNHKQHRYVSSPSQTDPPSLLG